MDKILLRFELWWQASDPHHPLARTFPLAVQQQHRQDIVIAARRRGMQRRDTARQHRTVLEHRASRDTVGCRATLGSVAAVRADLQPVGCSQGDDKRAQGGSDSRVTYDILPVREADEGQGM